jgi:hypothetical protein
LFFWFEKNAQAGYKRHPEAVVLAPARPGLVKFHHILQARAPVKALLWAGFLKRFFDLTRQN